MAETQTFPRKKIVTNSLIHNVRCDECKEERSSPTLVVVDKWWVIHDESHHMHYWQTAEVIDG
jgi:hypothetical protein